MAPLVEELERAGFVAVATIAQTGNIVLTTELDEAATARAVEAAVLASSGTATVAVPIGAGDLDAVLERTSLFGIVDPARVLAVVMDRPAPVGAIDDLEHLDPGRVELIGRILVHSCPDGVSNSPSAVSFVERRWGVTATARNVRMIERIVTALG